MKPLSSSEQLIERLVLTQLKQNIDILSILKEVFKANNVVVMQTSVDLDLRHKLLLGTSLGERRLRNDFCCRNSLVFQVCELKASGEATLSEESASSVGDDFAWFIMVFRSKRLNFLLNYLIVSQKRV